MTALANPDAPQESTAPQATGLSVERMQALLASSWDILSLLDAEGRLIYNSPAAQRLHGFEPEEMAGRPTFDFYHPDDAPLVGEVFQACLAQPGQPVRVQYRYARKDGSWIWMEAVAVNRLDDPAIQAIVVNSRDISERMASQTALRESERMLHRSQKMESLGSLAGGVAHDMNNVLGSILGMASMHQELQPPGSETQRAFAIIAKACQRGSGLVRRLLDFARHDLSEEKVLDLNILIQEEIQLLERTTLGGIRLHTELDPGAPAIRGDASALVHAIMNLCLNAIDAMPGGGDLTLRTCASLPGWVELQVEDTGHGMSKEVLGKALDPFFTTKPPDKGTGLGLPIVYSTMSAHRGTLSLESEAGRGTRVSLRFPAAPVEAQAGPEPPSAPGPSAASLEILLVDDDELIRGTLESLLRCLGHRVHPVASGEEALQMVRSGYDPQVVILDMNMPGLGGQGTLPLLRESRPALPVLLATGRVDQGALDLARAYPGVRLLSKPFTMDDLKASLDLIGSPAGR